MGSAFGAAEAIRMTRETLPDVAFVDRQLRSRSSGQEVARALREMEGATIVFVSANARFLDDDIEGAAAVIAKPFSNAVVEHSLPYLAECVRRPPPSFRLPLGMRLSPAYEARMASIRAS